MLKVLVIALCLWLVVIAAMRGLADYYADQSYQLVSSWRAAPELAEWERAKGALDSALRLDATNPTYHHRMGRLYHIGMGLDPAQSAAFADLASAHFLSSLDVRPAWPLTWAGVALLKADLRQFDDEFSNAVLNATRYGPWEPGVHQIMAGIGGRGLILMRPDVRQAIAASNVRGLLSPVRRANTAVLAALESYSMFDRPHILPSLAHLLITEDWVAVRAGNFARIAFMFWRQWDNATQSMLVDKIVAAADETAVFAQVQKAGQLDEICPKLPENSGRKRLCPK